MDVGRPVTVEKRVREATGPLTWKPAEDWDQLMMKIDRKQRPCHDVDLKLMQINVKQIMRLCYPCFHSGEKQGLK